MAESFFHIGLIHFLVVSFLLLAAGIATMLTKRNAIGILIGVELVLNAASINFVAFNRYSWAEAAGPTVVATAAATHEAAATQPARLSAAPSATVPPVPPVPAVALAPAADVDNTSDDHAVAAAALPVVAAAVPAPMLDGQMFAIFIIVLAAAEAAVALAIFLNFYNNFSSIDVERGDEMKG